MKKNFLLFLFALGGIIMSCTRGEGGTASRPAADTLSPLQRWQYERFGMFIHWGPYSEAGGVWKGETCHGFYAEHLMRHFQIPVEVYRKEVAGKFNPYKFNAEEWVRILKNAGMGYMVITAKHHDGFAMWDSDLTDYDIVDATPFHRDPMKELKEACKKNGILFGFYYSHAQDWADPNGVRNTWDYPGQPTVKNWWKTDSSYYERIKKYYYEKSIPQLIELIKKYDPDIIWFDTKTWGPSDLNRAVVDTALKYKPDLIINSRGAGDYRATYKSTNDKPVEFPYTQGLWEAIPSTNESYGYHKFDHTHHPPGYFIEMLSKAAAKGGNLLLNVGPRGDGTIDIVDQGILGGIGEWMATNKEAIKGTSANPISSQSFGEITRKGNILYCHIFQWPRDGRLVIGGVTTPVKRAWLLINPDKKDLPVKRLNKYDVEITLPTYPQERPVAVLAVECEKIEPHRYPRLLLTNIEKNRLHVIDAKLHGKRLMYAGGNWRTDFLKNWLNEDNYVDWKVRNNKDATFDIYISYDATPKSDGNRYQVIVGHEAFPGTVIQGIHHEHLYVGRVSLKKGEHTLTVKPAGKFHDELFRLRDLVLVPVKK